MHAIGCTASGAASPAGGDGRRAASPAGWSASEEEEADFEDGIDEI